MLESVEIAIDARLIASSGIGRYTRELTAALCRLCPEVRVTLVGNPASIEWAVEQSGLPRDRVTIEAFDAPVYSFREQVLGALAFRKVEADLLFFPHYNVPVVLTRPFIVTIHDLAHLRFPETFGVVRSRVARLVMSRTVQQARHVMTDSASSRNDIQSFFPKSEGKVTAIPCGVNPIFTPAQCEEIDSFLSAAGLPRRYILTVGNRKPHKNLECAAAAMEIVQSYDPTVAWLVVGSRFAPTDPVARARGILPGRLIEMQHVSDEVLRLLYAGAIALLMPSRWEGFGLPALEAMACAAPVITSNTPALSELVGGAGFTCPPTDHHAFAATIKKLMEDEALRNELRSRGLNRSRQFRWEVAATGFARLIKEAMLV